MISFKPQKYFLTPQRWLRWTQFLDNGLQVQVCTQNKAEHVFYESDRTRANVWTEEYFIPQTEH
jgi:hypothetical protein